MGMSIFGPLEYLFLNLHRKIPKEREKKNQKFFLFFFFFCSLEEKKNYTSFFSGPLFLGGVCTTRNVRYVRILLRGFEHQDYVAMVVFIH